MTKQDQDVCSRLARLRDVSILFVPVFAKSLEPCVSSFEHHSMKKTLTNLEEFNERSISWLGGQST